MTHHAQVHARVLELFVLQLQMMTVIIHVPAQTHLARQLIILNKMKK
jgi:hypothetical protein